jgi:mRNA interferase RelE/StbE
LDRQAAQRIGIYLQEVVTSCSHPRERETSLTAHRVGLWCYRVGDYRVICELEDERLLVLVVRVTHHSAAYR